MRVWRMHIPFSWYQWDSIVRAKDWRGGVSRSMLILYISMGSGNRNSLGQEGFQRPFSVLCSSLPPRLPARSPKGTPDFRAMSVLITTRLYQRLQIPLRPSGIQSRETNTSSKQGVGHTSGRKLTPMITITVRKPKIGIVPHHPERTWTGKRSWETDGMLTPCSSIM